MKIRKRRLQLFILLFAMCSLLFQLPSEAFADSNSSGSVKSIAVINDSTENGPVLDNNDRFGWSVANIGDLDGDGVKDIAAGAIYDGTGGNKKGAVHIMFMESDGSVKSTAVINDSTENGPDLTGGDQFGYSVEHLGDLDGDGVNDLAVGAINDDEGTGTNLGAVHIIFMNTDGSVASIVEINSSTTNGPSLAASDNFGTSIANIGDLNNDGVNDLAVGALGDDGGGTNRGAVHIMYMNTDGSVDSTVEINDSTENGPTLSDDDEFGTSIANIGDLNNDGVNDLAVGALGDDGGGTNRGAVHIMYMNTDGSVDSTVEINDSTENGPTLSDDDEFGTSIANIGDLNNDGVNDLAVGALGDDGGGTNRGAVHIMYMNTDGSVDSTVEINDSTENGPDLNSNDDFGESVENLGDLDGDGVNDLAVGASKDNANGNNDGTIHIMYMNTDGSVKSTVEINAGITNGPAVSATERFGKSIAEIGDFDSNCINDLAVGAYNADDPGNNRGEVHIIFMEDENPDVDCVTSSTSSTSGTCSKHIILGNCGTIEINNDEYRIINTWTNVPTTEVLVGQPVTVTLSTPNNPTYTKIHFASVHTEFFSIPANFDQTAHIDYSPMNNQVTYVSQSQLFQVAGATHRISQDPDVKNLEMFEVVFTMIFAKPMDTSHVVVETRNAHGIPETLYLLDALKVNENLAQALTLEEKSKFSIIDPELEMDPEPEMDQEPEMEMDPEPEQTKKEKSKRPR